MGGIGRLCRWERRSPCCSTTTRVVQSFLCDKGWAEGAIPPPITREDGGGQGNGEVEEEEGPPPPLEYDFPLSFFLVRLLLPLGDVWGKQEKGLRHFDSRMQQGFAEDCWSGTESWAYTEKSTAAAVTHSGLYMQLNKYGRFTTTLLHAT